MQLKIEEEKKNILPNDPRDALQIIKEKMVVDLRAFINTYYGGVGAYPSIYATNKPSDLKKECAKNKLIKHAAVLIDFHLSGLSKNQYYIEKRILPTSTRMEVHGHEINRQTFYELVKLSKEYMIFN